MLSNGGGSSPRTSVSWGSCYSLRLRSCVTEAGPRHTLLRVPGELRDSWTPLGPHSQSPSPQEQFPLPRRLLPSGSIGSAGIQFSLIWCSSARGPRASPHSGMRMEALSASLLSHPLAETNWTLHRWTHWSHHHFEALGSLTAPRKQAVTTRSLIWRWHTPRPGT